MCFMVRYVTSLSREHFMTLDKNIIRYVLRCFLLYDFIHKVIY